jgi:Predicted membrane protein
VRKVVFYCLAHHKKNAEDYPWGHIQVPPPPSFYPPPPPPLSSSCFPPLHPLFLLLVSPYSSNLFLFPPSIFCLEYTRLVVNPVRNKKKEEKGEEEREKKEKGEKKEHKMKKKEKGGKEEGGRGGEEGRGLEEEEEEEEEGKKEEEKKEEEEGEEKEIRIIHNSILYLRFLPSLPPSPL